MKRSEINKLIASSIEFFDRMNFKLPPWAFRKPEEWKGQDELCSEIVDNMLGWDLTDFGSGDFQKCGLMLFTIRNGNPAKDRKPYAGKIMIVDEMQEVLGVEIKRPKSGKGKTPYEKTRERKRFRRRADRQ